MKKNDEFDELIKIELIKICKTKCKPIESERKWEVWEKICKRSFEWNPLCSDYMGNIWLCGSILIIDVGIVEMQVKIVYSERGKKEMIEKFGEKYKKLDHTLVLFIFNCKQRSFQVLLKPINLLEPINQKILSEWDNEIPPGSIVEALFKQVCI
jgi:hypothetical protein